jgi:hypothetical protein
VTPEINVTRVNELPAPEDDRRVLLEVFGHGAFAKIR